MKVPPLRAFDSFVQHKKILGPPIKEPLSFKYQNDTVAFSSTAKYFKKYSTLPDEIKSIISPQEAVNMFKDMELVAQGKVKRPKIGQGANSQVYETPWLKDYYFIILKDDTPPTTQLVYSDKNLGNAIWHDKDDSRIQIIQSIK